MYAALKKIHNDDISYRHMKNIFEIYLKLMCLNTTQELIDLVI